MRVEYLLNGQSVNPVKREDIFLEVNHNQEDTIGEPVPHVGINNLYFAREDIRYIRSLLAQPPGITEGIPFDIRITENGQTQVVNMYLDLMNGFANSVDGMQTSVKMLQSLDWLDDRVDAFTFESLYNETGVQPFTIDGVLYNSWQQYLDAKTIYIPYVISTIPNWHDAFLALFAITYIGNELFKVTKDIEAAIASVSASWFSWGELARLAILIAYAAVLIITLIAMVEQLIACLIQPVKYHGAMLVKDMIKLAAAKMGMQAQSSIWDTYPFNQVAILPEKYNVIEGNPSSFNLLGTGINGFGTKGYTSPGYAPGTVHDSQTPGIQKGFFNGTGGDLLRIAKQVCNGKIIIPDGTQDLVIERRDYYPPSTPYQLPPLRQDWNGYNTDELTANILIRFQADLNDRNCIDHIGPGGVPFYPGTIFQATHQQIATTNERLVMLKGIREIQLPLARGVAKDSLTFIERTVKDLEVVWNIIENVLIGIIDVFIVVADILIAIINLLISIWNAIMFVLGLITDVINIIIDAINLLPGIDIDNIPDWTRGLHIDYISMIQLKDFQSLSSHNFDNRIDALLLENDMVTVPKLLMVDTSRSEFTGQRIAYLHNGNQGTIHAENLWRKFYFIDAFINQQTQSGENPSTDLTHNRYTKITPSLNHDGDHNLIRLSLADFKNLVSNPKFLDSWGEPVIADSIQWHIEQNGAALFSYRKSGWLKDPQHPNVVKRGEEIALNLKLKTIVPNGQ